MEQVPEYLAMPKEEHTAKKKIIVIITVLAFLGVFGGTLLLSQMKNQERNVAVNPTPFPSPTTVPFTQVLPRTKLMLEPKELDASAITEQTLDVTIDTGDNEVIVAYLELAFAPTIVTIIDIKPGDFFEDPLYYKEIDQEAGKLHFDIGIPTGQSARKGRGTVATITLRIQRPDSETGIDQTKITFDSSTEVYAQDADDSVVFKTEAAEIVF